MAVIVVLLCMHVRFWAYVSCIARLYVPLIRARVSSIEIVNADVQYQYSYIIVQFTKFSAVLFQYRVFGSIRLSIFLSSVFFVSFLVLISYGFYWCKNYKITIKSVVLCYFSFF